MATPRATALNNVWNFLGGSLSLQGHEKALKTALYNALAMLLLVVCCAATYALYFILDPFLKPLIWALLLGSVLHPFKYSLVYTVRNWLDVIEIKGNNIAIAFFMIPVYAFDRMSDRIGDLIYKHLKILFILTVVVPFFFLLYGYTPQVCVCLLWRIVYGLYSAVNFFVGAVSSTLLVSAICGYFGALVIWWRPELSARFSLLGCAMWCLLACYLAQFIGQSYQVLAFLFVLACYTVGFVYEKWTTSASYKTAKERHMSIVEAIVKKATSSHQAENTESISQPLPSLPDKETEPTNSGGASENRVEKVASDAEEIVQSTESSEVDAPHLSKEYSFLARSIPTTNTLTPFSLTTLEAQFKSQTIRAVRPTSLKSTPPEPDAITSDRCLYVLGWTCLAVFLWNHMWFLHFLPIIIFIYIFKHSGHYFGLWRWMNAQIAIIKENTTLWCTSRQDALCPPFVCGLVKIQEMIRTTVIQSLRDSVDAAASVLVILGLLVFVISTTIFISVNVYAEGIHLIQVAGSAINKTLSNNQEVLALLPEGVQEKLHLVLDNAYVYGRQSISNMVHAVLKNADTEKADLLEQRVLELWDRVYQAWMMTSSDVPGAYGPQVSSSAVYASWENFLDGVQKTPELLNLDGLIQFAKENVGMLTSLLESLWDILKGNVNLLFQSSVTIFSVVLEGGSAVINFIINSVVFFTALFYLLSSSGSLYRPVELVAGFSPSSGNQIAVAIDGAVGDVFRASFKMAVFHGLWAWLIHTLFGVKVVYLPSVLAAILGVVPFLGTYWACIPAVLELWLAQGCSMLAVIMILAFYIPTSWLNSLVYEEIKGGHPYLTGLSIAGGVYCMGSEGAIFGPLLLCCVFVALNISTSLMKEPSLSHLSPINLLRNMRPLRRRDTLGF